jgi:hypothetical protein
MNGFKLGAIVLAALPMATRGAWGSQKCTHIDVELNGIAISAPRKVSLSKTSAPAVTVPVKDGCFRLPQKLRHAKSLDVIFVVGKDRIHLTGIEPSAFGMKWNLKLRDNPGEDAFAAFKNIPAREICVLEFEPGGDSTAMIQTGCRTTAKTGNVPPTLK